MSTASASAPAPLSLPITHLPLGSILVVDRERLDLGDIEGLMESIITFGQLMPLLVRKEDMRLIDGGRRYEALSRLNLPTALVLFREDVTDDELKILEVETNERRKALTWKEKANAIVKIHKLRKKFSARIGENWTQFATGQLLGVQVAQVNYAILVVEALQDVTHPAHKAESMAEAIRIIAQLREDALAKSLNQQSISAVAIAATAVPVVGVEAQLETATQDQTRDEVGILSDLLGVDPTTTPPPSGTPASLPGSATHSTIEGVSAPHSPQATPRITIPLSQLLHRAEALAFLATLDVESIDHIVTDPPYGISTENMSQTNTGIENINRVEGTHVVADNLVLLQKFFPAAYRVLKPESFLCMWYDLDHHEKLLSWATAAGFSPQRWPVHWIKLHPCINQAASKNFTKAIEHCLILRKGNATLTQAQSVNFIAADGRVDRAKYDNPFAKPAAVWQFLLNAIAIRGQTICDPFGGEFSCALAAIPLGLRPLACEIDEHHYYKGVEHVKKAYQALVPDVEFS
jgi:DNA modification methylase